MVSGREGPGMELSGWAGPDHRPLSTWKWHLISWEMKKDTVWKILCFMKISLAASGRGGWMQGQQWEEGEECGDFCNVPGQR